MTGIVILNLADREMGPIANVKSGLAAKEEKKEAPSKVETFDLFDLLEAVRFQQDDKFLQKIADVAAACAKASKIYLCTHGLATDTDNLFADAAGAGGAIGTWEDLGRLLLRIFSSQTVNYDVALVMCYGARTDRYRASDINHNGQIEPKLIRTSFAYKLFQYMSRNARHIRMTARTGAVGFDRKTGKSSVQQEVAVDIALDKEEFLRSPGFEEINAKFIKHYNYYMKSRNVAEKQALQFNDDRQKFKDDPSRYANPFSKYETDLKAYSKAIAKKTAFEYAGFEHPDLEKYGKIIYTYVNGSLVIVNKYGSNETGLPANAVLYEGPLL